MPHFLSILAILSSFSLAVSAKEKKSLTYEELQGRPSLKKIFENYNEVRKGPYKAAKQLQPHMSEEDEKFLREQIKEHDIKQLPPIEIKESFRVIRIILNDTRMTFELIQKPKPTIKLQGYPLQLKHYKSLEARTEYIHRVLKKTGLTKLKSSQMNWILLPFAYAETVDYEELSGRDGWGPDGLNKWGLNIVGALASYASETESCYQNSRSCEHFLHLDAMTEEIRSNWLYPKGEVKLTCTAPTGQGNAGTSQRGFKLKIQERDGGYGSVVEHVDMKYTPTESTSYQAIHRGNYGLLHGGEVIVKTRKEGPKAYNIDKAYSRGLNKSTADPGMPTVVEWDHNGTPQKGYRLLNLAKAAAACCNGDDKGLSPGDPRSCQERFNNHFNDTSYTGLDADYQGDSSTTGEDGQR